MRDNEMIYNNWANQGLLALNLFFKGNTSERTIIQITMSACVCAHLDKRHKRETTQTLQKFAWAHGFIVGECSTEKYSNSGYFDKNYVDKIIAIL